MKISKKVIGIGIASLGMLFSIGGAVALYTTAAEDAHFGISAGAYAGSGGSVTYKINDASGNSNVAPSYLTTGGEGGGTGLSATYTQVEYSMALSAAYAGNNAQDYVVGNLSISLTNIPEAYRGKLAVWAVIDGYTASSLGEHYYKNVFMAEDFAITAEEGHQSFAGAHDVAVSSAGTQVLHIYLKYNLAGIDTLTQNEAGLGYTLAVAWGQPSNSFVPAYVMADANQWTSDDGFSMAPNINKAHAEGWEWVYNNLPGTVGHSKCLGPDHEHENQLTIWSSGVDAELDAEKTYNVYWDGNGEHAASFSPIV